MRIFFLLLVLLNLAFFTWHFQQGFNVESAVGVSPVDDSIRSLTLLSELSQQQSLELKTSPVADEAVPVDKLCYTLGPFTTRDAAGQAKTVLLAKGINIKSREGQQSVHTGYWIYLPEREDIQHARSTEQEIHAKGLRDTSIVPVGDHRYVVSLGVFSRRDTSDARYAKVTSLGYRPHVEERFKSLPVWWIDLRQDEQGLRAEMLVSEFPGLIVREMPCI